MPVTLKRVDGKVTVSTPGGVKAKRTTLTKALRQRRLLHAVMHGRRPTR